MGSEDLNTCLHACSPSILTIWVIFATFLPLFYIEIYECYQSLATTFLTMYTCTKFYCCPHPLAKKITSQYKLVETWWGTRSSVSVEPFWNIPWYKYIYIYVFISIYLSIYLCVFLYFLKKLINNCVQLYTCTHMHTHAHSYKRCVKFKGKAVKY